MKLICCRKECGKEFERSKKPRRKNWYCCKKCYMQELSEFNKTQNPINKSSYWTIERKKQQRIRIKETCQDGQKAYRKFHQRHLHRQVAEQMLGRPLLNGEIVHHKNNNKLDNTRENLEVMTQSQHASLHMKEYWRKKRGGDVIECSKE